MVSAPSWLPLALAVAIGLALLAACTDATEAVESDRSRLLALCPNPLVFQTDDLPRPEQGALYNLTGGMGRFNPSSGVFSGPLAADPSIIVQIRSGGRFIGDRTTIEAMAADEEVFLALVDTDEAVAAYGRNPTTAVVAPLDISPLMLMWDPDSYEIEAWNDLKKTKATVSHSDGATYPGFLVSAGLVTTDQLTADYDGSPVRFIRENGALIQEGSATHDLYLYENVIDGWGRPVGWLLIHDAGYELYDGALSILDRRMDQTARGCLAGLVPVLQQSIVDFQRDPSTANSVILDAVDTLGGSWTLTEDHAIDTVVRMGALGIVGNGSDNTTGSFDVGRVRELLKQMRDNRSVAVQPGLKADDLVTNTYIDPDIRL